MSRKKASTNDPKKQADSGMPEAFEVRALALATPGPELQAACLALCLQAKNLYNSVHFAVRNVVTAYAKVAESWVLGESLHESQRAAIDRFNAAIDSLNEARRARHEAALAAGGEKADKARLTLIPRLDVQIESLYRTTLDETVLDNVMREWPGADGKAVYGRLPAKCSQQVLRRYRAAWSGYFESLKTFAAGGAAMTGKPRPPDYLAKEGRYVVELPLTQIGDCLIGLGERKIPVDFAETVSLTAEEMDAWNGYRIGDAVAAACAKRGFPGGAKPQHLRIVPHKRGVKLEVVVRVPRSTPEDSLLAKLLAEVGDDLPSTPSKRNDALLAALARRGGVSVAGIDFGVTNTAAIAFGNGRRAQVVSAGRLERVLARFDRQIDALVSSLTTPRLRALQARKETLRAEGSRLPRAEEMELRKGLKALHADPAYLALRGRRERWLSDHMHKLSRGIVAMCAARGVQAIVVGQNKRWKDGMEMGRTQNRRFGRIPIARLIELIRYKAEALGIVVVATEESYTSKTSFVGNEALKKHAGASRKGRAAKEEGGEAAASSATPQPPAPQELPAPMGRRLKHERHTFVNHDQTGRWARVHADVNAAFNIIRKVFGGFAYHAGLTLKYRLLRVSPRLGLAPIRI